jgi:hypothetical protein
MKKILLILCIGLYSIFSNATTMTKAGSIEGFEYSSSIKRSLSRELSVWVSTNQIQIGTANSMGGTFVDFDADVLGRASQFSALLAKALEWGDIAIKNNADVSKSVGVIKDKGQVEIMFSSIVSNGVTTVSVRIDIEDWENRFFSSKVYLMGLEQIREFKSIFDNIGIVLEEAQRKQSNESLFN